MIKMMSFPQTTRIGLLFGNERTGLTSEELRSSNFRFAMPQASKQPSYNLAYAVLLRSVKKEILIGQTGKIFKSFPLSNRNKQQFAVDIPL